MPSLINNLTNFADQVVSILLADGTIATLELIYQGATERWIMNVVYGTVVINGLGLCCYPNVLRQFKNIIPFGIACVTANQTDPFDINDFSSGRVSLYVLSSAEVNTIENTVIG